MNQEVRCINLEAILPEPISQIPIGKVGSEGYGLSRPFNRDRTLDAFNVVKNVLGILDRPDLPYGSEGAVADLAFVTKCFTTIHAASKNSWFDLSRLFGYPAQSISGELAQQFHRLRYGIAYYEGDVAEAAKDVLLSDYAPEMLENFTDCIKGSTVPEERGWAYIAWSPNIDAINPICAMGARDGTIPEIMEEVSNSYKRPLKRMGPLAAWLVHDVARAEATIRAVMAGYESSSGFYMLGPRTARENIESALSQDDNLVMSPWHGDDHEVVPAARAGLR